MGGERRRERGVKEIVSPKRMPTSHIIFNCRPRPEGGEREFFFFFFFFFFFCFFFWGGGGGRREKRGEKGGRKGVRN